MRSQKSDPEDDSAEDLDNGQKQYTIVHCAAGLLSMRISEEGGLNQLLYAILDPSNYPVSVNSIKVIVCYFGFGVKILYHRLTDSCARSCVIPESFV